MKIKMKGRRGVESDDQIINYSFFCIKTETKAKILKRLQQKLNEKTATTALDWMGSSRLTIASKEDQRISKALMIVKVLVGTNKGAANYETDSEFFIELCRWCRFYLI